MCSCVFSLWRGLLPPRVLQAKWRNSHDQRMSLRRLLKRRQAFRDHHVKAISKLQAAQRGAVDRFMLAQRIDAVVVIQRWQRERLQRLPVLTTRKQQLDGVKTLPVHRVVREGMMVSGVPCFVSVDRCGDTYHVLAEHTDSTDRYKLMVTKDVVEGLLKRVRVVLVRLGCCCGGDARC